MNELDKEFRDAMVVCLNSLCSGLCVLADTLGQPRVGNVAENTKRQLYNATQKLNANELLVKEKTQEAPPQPEGTTPAAEEKRESS